MHTNCSEFWGNPRWFAVLFLTWKLQNYTYVTASLLYLALEINSCANFNILRGVFMTYKQCYKYSCVPLDIGCSILYQSKNSTSYCPGLYWSNTANTALYIQISDGTDISGQIRSSALKFQIFCTLIFFYFLKFKIVASPIQQYINLICLVPIKKGTIAEIILIPLLIRQHLINRVQN